MMCGTPRVANSFNPVPSAARPSRTALRMLFSFTCRLLPALGARAGAAQLVEVPPELDRARQWVPDDVFGELGALDHLVEVDAGLDAHLPAHEDQVFRAHVARRA